MKIAFMASDTADAQDAAKALTTKYGATDVDKADVIVALGGDGHMLQTLHSTMQRRIPIYGMNRGTVGFLMNEYSEENLINRIQTADPFILHPLRMLATTCEGQTVQYMAVNEVSLLRETRQAAKVCIAIDGKVRIPELVGDGLLVSTPAGSTAYNLSAHGTIIPLGADLLNLTPLSAFRPRRWRGALLPHTVSVELNVIHPEKRPVSAVADMHEVRDVKKVVIEEAREINLHLLFDREHNLAERIFTEQFAH